MIRSMMPPWVIPEAAAWWKRTVEGVRPGSVFGSRTATRPSDRTNMSIRAYPFRLRARKVLTAVSRIFSSCSAGSRAGVLFSPWP
jgi:hypothetical protein